MIEFSVLIADDDMEWCDILKRQLESSGPFRVLPPVYDGEAAISLIEDTRPDVVVLDLIMPGFDGLYIIDHIRGSMVGYNPFIYVVSGIGTQRTNRILRDQEVAYYSIKPIKSVSVAANIKRMLAQPPSVQPQYESVEEEPVDFSMASPFNVDLLIDDYLLEMGASISLISTKCTRIAIKKIILEEKKITGTMCLYQMVASEFEPNVSVSSVERNIRSTLTCIKKRSNVFFQKSFAETDANITNAHFLYTSAHIIKQRMKQASAERTYR